MKKSWRKKQQISYFYFMKHLLIIVLGFFSLYACQTKKNTVNEDDLPKDIREKSDWYLFTTNFSNEEIEEAKVKLLEEMKNLANSKSCDSIAEWTFSGIGLNECGRAEDFIAYPKDVEKNMKNKISHYNSLVTASFPKTTEKPKCPEVKRPKGIKCEEGKPEFIFDEDN